MCQHHAHGPSQRCTSEALPNKVPMIVTNNSYLLTQRKQTCGILALWLQCTLWIGCWFPCAWHFLCEKTHRQQSFKKSAYTCERHYALDSKFLLYTQLIFNPHTMERLIRFVVSGELAKCQLCIESGSARLPGYGFKKMDETLHVLRVRPTLSQCISV
jgi:hypothetical protein